MTNTALAKCAGSTIVTLFRLLGWIFAEKGDKCMPLSDVCHALVVSLDLSNSSMGFAFISNTSSKVQELCADLDELIASGHLNAQSAQRLRVRMQFAEAQIFGRIGPRCLKKC